MHKPTFIVQIHDINVNRYIAEFNRKNRVQENT